MDFTARALSAEEREKKEEELQKNLQGLLERKNQTAEQSMEEAVIIILRNYSFCDCLMLEDILKNAGFAKVCTEIDITLTEVLHQLIEDGKVEMGHSEVKYIGNRLDTAANS